MSEEEIYKALGYSAQPFGYSNDELQRIADGEKVFPMCSAPTATAAISWCAPCLPPECP